MCRPNCFLHARVIPDTPPIKSSIGNDEIPVTIGAQDEHVKKTTTPWSRRTHSLFARWLAVAALQQPSRPQLRRVVPYHQMAVLPSGFEWARISRGAITEVAPAASCCATATRAGATLELCRLASWLSFRGGPTCAGGAGHLREFLPHDVICRSSKR